MKVAVCTTDGAEVDLHFGKTSTFYIYETNGGGMTLFEKRDVEKYCSSDEFLNDDGSDTFQLAKIEKIFGAIKDCEKLYTVQIGDKPMKELMEKGLRVQKCSCAVDSISSCGENCK